MRGTLTALVLATSLLPACVDCLEQGQNGFPPPAENEFQLLFNNIVSRETDVYVDGVKACTVCQETEFAVLGNFPVSTHTRLSVYSNVSGSTCHISPCCSSNCDSQTCSGEPVVDTTPFAGDVYHTGLIWRF